jgi:uncharacterized protein (TIGR00369 family)
VDPEIMRQIAEEMIPFNRFLGLRAVSIAHGAIELEIPWRDELIGDPMKGVMHGGVMSMLADTAGGLAVWSALPNMMSRVSTIDLRVDYLLPGKQETLRAEAKTVRVGKTVGVADVRLFQPSEPGATVATGKGVYAIRIAKSTEPFPPLRATGG